MTYKYKLLGDVNTCYVRVTVNAVEIFPIDGNEITNVTGGGYYNFVEYEEKEFEKLPSGVWKLTLGEGFPGGDTVREITIEGNFIDDTVDHYTIELGGGGGVWAYRNAVNILEPNITFKTTRSGARIYFDGEIVYTTVAEDLNTVIDLTAYGEVTPEPDPTYEVIFNGHGFTVEIDGIVYEPNVVHTLPLNHGPATMTGHGYTIDRVDGGYYDPEEYEEKGYFTRYTDYLWVASNPPLAPSYQVFTTLISDDVDSPFNTLYAMDRKTVIELSEALPAIYGMTSGNVQIYPYNDTMFVINLLSLPFKIPDEYLTDLKASINVGRANTGVMSNQLVNDKLTIDLGKIVVDDLYGSSRDYDQVKYQLTLPYLSFTLDLDPSYVVGKTVSAVLVIDAYRGDFTVNVYSDGDLVDFRAERLGRVIPIHLFYQTVGSLANPTYMENGVNAASIRAIRSEVTYARVGVEERIGDCEGFIRVQDDAVVNLPGVSNTEKVLTLLREGVIVRP